jgi:phage protein D
MPSDKNTFLRVRLGAASPFADLSPQVISVDIRDEDRGSDVATVVVADQAHVNAEALREGQEIRIEMGWESEHALLFMGEIRRTEAVAPAGGSTTGRVRLTAYDFSCRMQGRPAEEGRQHVGTLQSILTAMAERARIPVADVLIDPMPTWTEDRKLEQLSRSDWELIQDLAEQYRARAFVEVNATASDSEAELAAGGASRLYFISETALLAQEPLGKLNYCRGYSSLIEFRFQRVGQGASPSASLATVDPVTGQIGRETAPPLPPDGPAALGANQTEGLEAALGSARARSAAAAIDFANAQPNTPAVVRPVMERGGEASDPAHGRALIQRDQTRLLGLQGSGLAMGTVFLRAKGSVEISGLANGAAGRWYVRQVNHIFEKEGTGSATRRTFRSRFEATR